MFDDYIEHWKLIPDGDPIITHSSRLLPVQYQGIPAMLKIAMESEERWGNLLMIWWKGEGAARVLRHDDDALLMERAIGHRSLVAMSRSGHDDEASQIICSVTAKLHSHKDNPPTLLPLSRWFKELEVAASQQGGIFSESFTIAKELLDTPEDPVVLHGDIHHGNILDFGEHGWLAIDPKHLIGERGYDFANLFCNPDMEMATQPGRLTRQVDIVSKAAKLNRNRLLKWIFAYAGLSAAWTLAEGKKPELALSVAKLALQNLKTNV